MKQQRILYKVTVVKVATWETKPGLPKLECQKNKHMKQKKENKYMLISMYID